MVCQANAWLPGYPMPRFCEVIGIKAYGYEKNSDVLRDLSEISFHCDVEEVKKIVMFLVRVVKEHGAADPKSLCYSTYPDWDKAWTKESPDLMIITGEFEDEPR